MVIRCSRHLIIIRSFDGNATARWLAAIENLDNGLFSHASLSINWFLFRRLLLTATCNDSVVATAEGKNVSVGVLLGDCHSLVTLGSVLS